MKQKEEVESNLEVKEFVTEKDQEKRAEKYNDYVKTITPKHSCAVNCMKAFLVGGLICVLGQGILNVYLSMGVDKEVAATYESITLIGLSILLTGLNIYPSLAKFGGAGTVVPITGFANGMVSPALEYKVEGQVFGIGCKIFIIAGPVILYGVFCSWLLGLIYYVLTLMNVI